MTLLEEYQSLCVAIDILKPFFQKLVSVFIFPFAMKKDQIDDNVFTFFSGFWLLKLL